MTRKATEMFYGEGDGMWGEGDGMRGQRDGMWGQGDGTMAHGDTGMAHGTRAAVGTGLGTGQAGHVPIHPRAPQVQGDFISDPSQLFIASKSLLVPPIPPPGCFPTP